MEAGLDHRLIAQIVPQLVEDQREDHRNGVGFAALRHFERSDLIGAWSRQPALHILIRFQGQVNHRLITGSPRQFGQPIDGKPIGVDAGGAL